MELEDEATSIEEELDEALAREAAALKGKEEALEREAAALEELAVLRAQVARLSQN